MFETLRSGLAVQLRPNRSDFAERRAGRIDIVDPERRTPMPAAISISPVVSVPTGSVWQRGKPGDQPMARA
jgi:hypothetical protein